jgi:N utilization substance protein A
VGAGWPTFLFLLDLGEGKMNRELIAVISQMEREKGIKAQKIISAVEAALLSAARKKFGGADNIQVQLDPKTGEIQVVRLKTIVEAVTNPETEIALSEAQAVDESAELGDEIGTLLEMQDFSRVSAQTARQVIFQKVREAEWETVHHDYSSRIGEIVSGVILGQERKNYIVELGKAEALLPFSEQIPGESYRRGDRIRAYLLEVKPASKGPQIILSRTHPQFVVKLFEVEVPEIAEKVVIIREAVREAGDRTKICVQSKEARVDPVGACVGVRGSRVQAVVRELKGEKVDIITWTEDPKTFIGEALSPAVIEKVGVNEAERSALVVVSDAQLSLAIGKKGQNVRLASKLTGWKIDIINQGEYERERAKEQEQEIADAISKEQKALQDSEKAVPQEAETVVSDEGAKEQTTEAPITETTPEGQSAPENSKKADEVGEAKEATVTAGDAVNT